MDCLHDGRRLPMDEVQGEYGSEEDLMDKPIFGKCDRCGWVRPSGRHYHTREACDEMYVEKIEKERDALVRYARTLRKYAGHYVDKDKADEAVEILNNTYDALPESVRKEIESDDS